MGTANIEAAVVVENDQQGHQEAEAVNNIWCPGESQLGLENQHTQVTSCIWQKQNSICQSSMIQRTKKKLFRE